MYAIVVQEIQASGNQQVIYLLKKDEKKIDLSKQNLETSACGNISN